MADDGRQHPENGTGFDAPDLPDTDWPAAALPTPALTPGAARRRERRLMWLVVGLLAFIGVREASLFIRQRRATPAPTVAVAADTPVAPPPSVTDAGLAALADAGGAAMGVSTAPVTVYEFSDFQCPFCGVVAKAYANSFRPTYVQTGRVRWVMIDLPLESIHSRAYDAATLARCAGQQGAYEAIHDRLFAEQGRWSIALSAKPLFEDYARGAGLDLAKMRACRASSETRRGIESMVALADGFSIRGTPAFVIGRRIVRGTDTVAVRLSIDAELGASGR